MNQNALMKGGFRIMDNKYMKTRYKYHVVTLSLVIALMAVSLGCTVKLIADYDEIIDKTATDLQGKIETFLTRMERTAGTSEGEYDNNTAFYDEIKGVLSSMKVRARAIPKNELTVQHIELIEENIENLRKLHEKQKEKGLTKTYIDPARTALNTQFTALITLQNALKRGEEK
jgi:hypothetical protein